MSIVQNLANRKSIMNDMAHKNGYIEIDDDLRHQIQNALLEMLKDLDSVCAGHGITYFLCGGSCLGAVRHSGFIPWDDDVDISMTRDQYEKLKGIFEEELSDKYILNAPNYSAKSITRFPKILKKDSLYVTGDTTDPELCRLFLDIFIVDNIPDNRIAKMSKGLICNALEFISGQVLFVRTADKEKKEQYRAYDRKSYYVRSLVGHVFSFFSVSHYNNMIDKVIQYRKNDTKMCGLPTGRKHYFGEILPREVFASVKYVPFEKYSFPIPVEYDKYMKNLYGDYMQIPPADKREHHYVKEVRL